MSAKWEQFCDEVNRLQRQQVKCACHHISARDCWDARHGRRADDFGDDYGEDDDCECSCHERIEEAADDIWPSDDEA